MGNSTYRFITAFFEVFLVYIVLANFVGWSGSSLAITGVADVDWNNSYVGMQSFVLASQDFHDIMHNSIDVSLSWFDGNIYSVSLYDFASFSNLLTYCRELLNACTGGLLELAISVTNGSFSYDPLDMVLVIVDLFLSPIQVIGYALAILVVMLTWVMVGATVFVRFIGGAYNIKDVAVDVWSQWSDLSSDYIDATSDWDWSSMVSAYFSLQM